MRKKVRYALLLLALCLALVSAAFAEGEAAASVVSVTIGGETTEYSNIFRAFESVKKVNTATIKLLDRLPERH